MDARPRELAIHAYCFFHPATLVMVDSVAVVMVASMEEHEGNKIERHKEAPEAQ